jgi:geranylgeranyl pyrophosphate synthase
MRACGALDATHAVANEYADRAREGLEGLDDSLPKQALAELPEFVLSRQM